MNLVMNYQEPSMERMVEFSYNVDDVVALASAIPEASLDAGIWGQVLDVLPNAMVEVEFQTRDGEVMQVAAVPEAALCLVWSEGDLA